MATKFTLTAALLVALLSLAAAASVTTTIITTSADEDTNPRFQQCRQMVQGRQFRPCQRYIQQRRSGSTFEEEEEEVIEMTTGREHLQECCQQLREMDRQQCGCAALRQAVRQAQESSYQAGESQQIYQRARQLPRVCGLRQQGCSFRIVLV